MFFTLLSVDDNSDNNTFIIAFHRFSYIEIRSIFNLAEIFDINLAFTMNLRKHETSLPTYATIHIHTEYHPCHYRLSLVKLSTNQKAVHFFSVPHKNILNISPAVEYFEKPRLHIRNFESKFNFVPLCADPTNSTTDALPVLRIKAPYATMRISVVRVG